MLEKRLLDNRLNDMLAYRFHSNKILLFVMLGRHCAYSTKLYNRSQFEIQTLKIDHRLYMCVYITLATNPYAQRLGSMHWLERLIQWKLKPTFRAYYQTTTHV